MLDVKILQCRQSLNAGGPRTAIGKEPQRLQLRKAADYVQALAKVVEGENFESLQLTDDGQLCRRVAHRLKAAQSLQARERREILDHVAANLGPLDIGWNIGPGLDG